MASPIQFPWPGKIEAENHRELTEWEEQLLELADLCTRHLRVHGAQVHIRNGLIRRHLMLQRCRMWLREECRKHKSTVGPYVATELSIYVNAFYVNLCGALDNLAWALTYELSLLPQVLEEQRRTQRFVNLGSPEFATALSLRLPDVSAQLEKDRAWLRELKKFRDPAAHRLPLTVVAGVLDEADHQEATRLQDLAKAAATRGNSSAFFELQRQVHALGRFYPWLESPQAINGGIFHVPNLVASDQAFYVSLARMALESLIAAIT
jgi:hypothetical protein